MNFTTHCHLVYRHHRYHFVATLIGVAILLLSQHATVSAQTGGGYDLTWSSIDNGGAVSTSANGYALAGSIGQPDAGVGASANGYNLSGGFWTLSQYRAYLPIAIRH